VRSHDLSHMTAINALRSCLQAVSKKYGNGGEASATGAPCVSTTPSSPPRLFAKPGPQEILVSWAKPSDGKAVPTLIQA
jgi:hypothetical protein